MDTENSNSYFYPLKVSFLFLAIIFTMMCNKSETIHKSVITTLTALRIMDINFIKHLHVITG